MFLSLIHILIAYMMREFLKGTDTPVGLHLDHGKSFDDVKACVDAGFTSIMVDASHLNFEENIKEVQKTVEYCHFCTSFIFSSKFRWEARCV